MKLSQNEKQGINTISMSVAIIDGLITYQEAWFYMILRDHAFPNKKTGERGISFVQVHQIGKKQRHKEA